MLKAIHSSERKLRLRKMTPHARQILLLRTCAVCYVLAKGGSLTKGRRATARFFAREFPGFLISPRSLERWQQLFASKGLAGLEDRKQGRSGRHPKNFAGKAGTRTDARARGRAPKGAKLQVRKHKRK